MFGLVKIMGLRLDELYDVHAGCGAISGSGGGGGKGKRAEPVPVPHDRWMTLLGYAAFLGEDKVVSALLKAGADPTVRSAVRTEGVRPACVACLARCRLLSLRLNSHNARLLIPSVFLSSNRNSTSSLFPLTVAYGVPPITSDGGGRAWRQRTHAPRRRQARADR